MRTTMRTYLIHTGTPARVPASQERSIDTITAIDSETHRAVPCRGDHPMVRR